MESKTQGMLLLLFPWGQGRGRIEARRERDWMEELGGGERGKTMGRELGDYQQSLILHGSAVLKAPFG